MTWCGRKFGVWAALGAGVILSGCMAQEPGKLPVSRDTPFVLNMPPSEGTNTVSRGQRPETPAAPVQKTNVPAPPAPPAAPTVSPTPGIQTVAATRVGGSTPAMRVRAWVNGKPLFDDEIVGDPQFARMVMSAPAAQQQATMVKAFNEVLKNLIDSELMEQEAMRKLEKNTKFLDQLKSRARKEADKAIASTMRGNNIATIEEFKQLMLQKGTSVDSIRRQLERNYIATEYLRAVLKPAFDQVGNQEIREYYNQHLNEFMQVDRVKWQDIFIATGAKHPTMGDAKDFAQQILKAWAGGEDIAKLLQFDDGQGTLNKGAGVGEIKGDIRPRELESYLFALKDGEFGPLVELSTGVHVFRVLKRERAGPMPFDEKTQTTIGNKLKNEIVDQERQRLVLELRDRAIIEILRD